MIATLEQPTIATRTLGTLDNDALLRRAPSIFATEPWHAMSGRYRFVPTIDVVEHLRSAGFLPVRAEQSTCRTEGKQDFTRHMIRFRHRDFMELATGAGHVIDRANGVGMPEFPELVLINSHDGAAALDFSVGIFRQVCLNGLCIPTGQMGGFKVRHTGSQSSAEFLGQVIDTTYEVVSCVPEAMKSIETFKAIELSHEHRETFARAALELRDTKSIAPESMLRTRRAEDNGQSLWKTLNTVQENLLKGGVRGRTPATGRNRGRRVTTRPVGSVAEDVRLNRALWMVAESFARHLS
jgi:hypothetical protein